MVEWRKNFTDFSDIPVPLCFQCLRALVMLRWREWVWVYLPRRLAWDWPQSPLLTSCSTLTYRLYVCESLNKREESKCTHTQRVSWVIPFKWQPLPLECNRNEKRAYYFNLVCSLFYLLLLSCKTTNTISLLLLKCSILVSIDPVSYSVLCWLLTILLCYQSINLITRWGLK